MPDPQIYTDKELFQQITAGNEQAFAICVHRFTPNLFPYIKSIVKADIWAEDLLQDLYIRLWKNRAKLAAVETPAAYLTRMASNMSLNFLKHRSVELKAQYRMNRERVANEDQAGGAIYDRRYYTQIIEEAVQQLSPQQQRIYRLRYEEDLSYEEIARELSISRNTVRNHLVAAMELVRNYLREHTEILLLVSVLLKNILK